MNVLTNAELIFYMLSCTCLGFAYGVHIGRIGKR